MNEEKDRFTVIIVDSPIMQTVLHIIDNETKREYLSVVGTKGGTSIIEIAKKENK